MTEYSSVILKYESTFYAWRIARHGCSHQSQSGDVLKRRKWSLSCQGHTVATSQLKFIWKTQNRNINKNEKQQVARAVNLSVLATYDCN